MRFRGRHKRWKRKRQRAIWKRGYYEHDYEHGKVRWYIRPGAVERDFGGPAAEYHKAVEAFLASTSVAPYTDDAPAAFLRIV